VNARAAALAAALVGIATPARGDVEYHVDLADRAAHRAAIEMVVRSAASPLELSMPVWTPGAYEVRTWGRNVTLTSADSRGKPLVCKRTGPSTFRIEGHAQGAEVHLRYHVYAPLLSDDGSQIDSTHAYLNGSSLFLQARGSEHAFHRVDLAVPPSWRVASALDDTPGGDLQALGYEALIDAPIEVGRFVEGEVRANGRPYRVVVDGATALPPALLKDVAAIAEAEARFVGPPPYKRYLLLIHLADGIGRVAALEHAASTSVVVPRRSLGGGQSDAYDELLYVIAHELFHAWNARRLRPAELVPYDFSRAQPARSLWITEGVTEYYAHRAMLASGRWSRAHYLERLGEEATRALSASQRGLTVEEDAELAWQPPDDAGADPDAYYARGHLVSLALDVAIRAASDGAHSLDEVMKALLAAADRAGGVLALDGDVLQRAIVPLGGAEVAQLVIAWTRAPDEPRKLESALAGVGLKLAIEEAPPRTVAGFAAEADGGALRVVGVLPDGPAFHAGLRAGDRVLFLDGIAPGRKWAESIAQKAPGTRLAMEAVRATRHLALTLELAAQRQLNCRLIEAPAPPPVAQRRDAWLR
jgi:predicted metalloprotease with PDZ domain